MNVMDQVIHTLEHNIPQMDDQFNAINEGGCGVMAQLVAEQLEELQVNYEIACKGGWSYDEGDVVTQDEVNTFIDNDDRGPVPNSHVLIKINGRYFDSMGEKKLKDGEIQALIDLDTMKRMNCMSVWNSVFDRSQEDNMREWTRNAFKDIK